MKLKAVYIIALAAILLSFIIIMTAAFSNIAATASAEAERCDTTFIIDAGHGGEDGGAQAGGALEKDINLSISNKLANILRLSGYNVKEVRDSDISVYSDPADTIREKKKSDLNNRVELFNSDERNVVISIHQNKFDDPKYSGTQVFYSVNNEKSIELAECVRTAVVMLLQPDNTRELKKGGSDIFILDKARVPAIIVECGFISNPDERQKLLNEEYQKELAYAIAMGALDYINKE